MNQSSEQCTVKLSNENTKFIGVLNVFKVNIKDTRTTSFDIVLVSLFLNFLTHLAGSWETH